MSELTTMDPALKKLLDDLPLEDPDREMVTVWCPWTEGEHEIPLGVETKVDFGDWHGPDMAVTDIVLWCRYKGDLCSSTVQPDADSEGRIRCPGVLRVNVLVTL